MRPLLALFALAACGAPHVVPLSSDVDVSREVDFGQAFVGHPVTRALSISSRSRLSTTHFLRVAAPFSAPAEVTVPGGEALEVPIVFSPLAEGPVTATLWVGDVEVSLRGVGLPTPECAQAESCRQSRFDPTLGRCVTEVLPDGAACDDGGCVEGGWCRAGACVGTPVNCDDANPCTRDVCAPGVGCQHLGDACPGSDDPCLAPACDTTTGCSLTPVADGTSCGDFSCASAMVCLSGQCRAVRPPDGAPCGTASPCESVGTCQAQRCVQTQSGPLEVAWRYEIWGVGYDSSLFFDGVVDEAGNLYWVECSPGFQPACGVVSFTSGGAERFRALLPTGNGEPMQLYDEGRFIVVFPHGPAVAFDADGQRLWESWAAFTPQAVPPPRAHTAVSDGHGDLWVGRGDELLRFESATGALLDTHPLQGALDWGSLVADEAGNVYATTQAGNVVSFTPGGQQRFAVTRAGATSAVIAAFADDVYFADDSRLHVPTLAFSSFIGPGAASPEVLAPSAGVVLRLTSDSESGTGVTRFDGATQQGTTLASLGDFAWASSLFLASSTPIVAVTAGFSSNDAHPRQLIGLEADGATAFTCSLENDIGCGAPGVTALTGTHLIVYDNPFDEMCDGARVRPGNAIVAYDVGDLGVASLGWVTRGGTPGRAGHPR